MPRRRDIAKRKVTPDPKFNDQVVEQIVAERERMSEALGDMPVDVVPSGANFLLFRPRGRAGRLVWQSLLDRGVLVRDCSGWPRLQDWLRVTIGTRAENSAFVIALAEALDESREDVPA